MKANLMLDDIDSRVGSTVSLLRTFVGLFMRELEWVSTRDFVAFMHDLGVNESATRNGLATLKQKGLLLSKKATGPGYVLNPIALEMLERGDQRIFEMRQMQDDEAFVLISFSVAETERSKRYQLRKRLEWLGCGSVAAGLWIAPWHLKEEISGLLAHHETAATFFKTTEVETPTGMQDAAFKWWDLDEIRGYYTEFLAAATEIIKVALPASKTGQLFHREVDPVQRRAAEAKETFAGQKSFMVFVRTVDAWRHIPYLDPGLPARLLPRDWPAEEAFQVFNLQRSRFEAAAREYVFGITH